MKLKLLDFSTMIVKNNFQNHLRRLLISLNLRSIC